MKAKEKATELINKFRPFADRGIQDSTSNEIESAEKIALIAVDEILSLKLWGKTDGENDKDFWAAVKAEILNVQPGDEVQCGVGKNNI